MRFWQLFENMSPSDIETVRIFAERALSRYNIDKLEFTQHFVQRALDERNRPKIKMAELLRFFKRHAKFNGKKHFSELDPWQQIILKDLKTDIIVVVNVKQGQKENSLKFVCATIQRKENYGHTIQKVFVIEDLVENEATDISPIEKGKKIKEGGVGRITKQNQTRDVGPDEVKKQAAKFGNTVDRDGRPPSLSKKTKGSKTNVLYNLGLAESVLDKLNIPRNKKPKISKKDSNMCTNESFDTEVEWVEVPSGDRTEYAAKVGEAYIELTYKPVDKAVYIQFTRGHSMGVTGEGLQNKIFGAVINHIKKWINKNKPQEIYFQAWKPRTGAFGSQDTTRSGLYRKMVQRFASQNGYDYDIEDRGSNDIFILKRKQSNVEENFADGKKKGKSRPGRFKKAGVSCKGSVTDLRKKAKNSSGEKQKGYHWCANMKSGRKKS